MPIPMKSSGSERSRWSLVQLFHRDLHLHRADDRMVHIVGVRNGRTEQDHDRVAHELVDRPAVAVDDFAHAHEIAIQHVEHDIRGMLRRDGRKPAQIREQDRHLAAQETPDLLRWHPGPAEAGEQRLQLRRSRTLQRRTRGLGNECLDAAQRFADGRFLHAFPGWMCPHCAHLRALA
jgi:hypothetical protein